MHDRLAVDCSRKLSVVGSVKSFRFIAGTFALADLMAQTRAITTGMLEQMSAMAAQHQRFADQLARLEENCQ